MRRLLGNSAGWYAAWLTIFHPILLIHSRQVRAYSLLILATTLVLFAVARYCVKSQRSSWTDHASIGAAGLMATSCHVFGIFIPAGIACGYVIEALRRRDFHDGIRGLVCLAPSAALFILWIGLLNERVQINLDSFWLQQPMWFDYLLFFLLVGPLSLLLLPVGLVFAVARIRQSRVAANNSPMTSYFAFTFAIAGVVLVGPLLASLLSRGAHHFVHHKYLVPAAPVFLTWLTIAVCRLPKNWRIPATLLYAAHAVVGVWMAGYLNIYSAGYPLNMNARAAAFHLRRNIERNDVFTAFPSGNEMTLYYYGLPRDQSIHSQDLVDAEFPEGGDIWFVAVYVPQEEFQTSFPKYRFSHQATFGSVNVYTAKRQSDVDH